MWRGFAIAIMLAGVARAEPPRSAIDWLSEAILQPPNFVITPPGRSSHALDAVIVNKSLDQVSLDAVGLLAVEDTGFPRALWKGMQTPQILARLKQAGPGALPAANSLYRRILLAQSDPPEDSPDGELLLARIDLLIAMGALDEAETLTLLAGSGRPDIFKRWFAVTLLDGRTNAPCEALHAKPFLSDDIATRTICLARAGDWNAAAITVSLGESLGQIAVEDADLLVRFLDPEMFAGLEDPGPPDPMDEITFVLRESLALPRPESPLPLPYLNADMNLRTPARQRILAAERLVRASAVPAPLLFAAYRGARAASSGGAWGRAEVTQALDQALVSEDDERLARALDAAISAFAEADLLFAFADEYGDILAHFPPGPETGQIAPRIRQILLLTGRPLAAWAGLGPDDTPNTRFATLLASKAPVEGISPYQQPIPDAIHAAFSNLTPPQSDLPQMLKQIDNGQFGEILLQALAMLKDGHAADPRDIHAGIYLLLKLGLEDAARKIAIELLLLPPDAA